MPDYKIEWLPEAAQDVARLRQFIKSKNPNAAKKAGQRIMDAVNLLKKNPRAGIPCQDDGCEMFNDLYAPFGKGGYTIRYRLKPHTVLITRIWHSREERF